MRSKSNTTIIKTCPNCSDPDLSILQPNAERFCGHHAVAGPLKLKIRKGLPTQVTVKCTACSVESTWNLNQADPQTRTIDYTEQT